jgi:hypothetical protein
MSIQDFSLLGACASCEVGYSEIESDKCYCPYRALQLYFYLAVSHAIAAAFRDMGTGPNPDATSDVAANHPFAKALGEDHGLL